MGVWVFLYTHIYGVCAPTHREDKRHRKSEESREVGRQAGRQADRHRYIQADRQTDRQIDRQIDRKDRQTDIHILRRGGRGSISKKRYNTFCASSQKDKNRDQILWGSVVGGCYSVTGTSFRNTYPSVSFHVGWVTVMILAQHKPKLGFDSKARIGRMGIDTRGYLSRRPRFHILRPLLDYCRAASNDSREEISVRDKRGEKCT